MPARFVELPVGMRELLFSPTGPVGRYLIRLGEEVQAAAKIKVGYSDRAAIPGDMRRPVTGPHLRDTIVRKFTIDSSLGPEMQVGSALPYAEYHHEGTPEYEINSVGLMVFYGRDGWVFTHHVTHPVWEGNPFLREPMEAIVQSGVAVTVRDFLGLA